MREMQVPFRKIMVRQEDMGREVVGSNPVLAKDFSLIKYPFKCTCIIILSWNLFIIEA